MSEKSEYGQSDIKKLEWQEHIRMRPGMYIGQASERGFMEMFKGVICASITNAGAKRFSFDLRDNGQGKFQFDNHMGDLANNWGRINHSARSPLILDHVVLNALSKYFEISFSDSGHNNLYTQRFEEGRVVEGEEIDAIDCSYVTVDFQLDEKIWGEDFQWNKMYIIHQIREFAYLYKNTKFEIKYREEEEECKMIFQFKNGLKDRIDIELLSGMGGATFEAMIDEQIGDFRIEAAFAFRDYAIDAPYIKSYVNDYFTLENGSHVDGLLKGLTYGVMKYFQKHDLVDKYKISEKGMKENLVAALNIKMDEPAFSGCVKNKLASSEVVEPIADYVSELFFKKIQEDEIATKRLIRKFEM